MFVMCKNLNFPVSSLLSLDLEDFALFMINILVQGYF